MNIQDAAFTVDDEYKTYDERPYYYEENSNAQVLTLRNGGFSQRLKNNAIYYLDALQRDGEGAKDAIQTFENSIKHINKTSIDNPLYGILNSRQNRQEIDPVIQYLAKVADICYMAARQYRKKVEESDRILDLCEKYTSKRITQIVNAVPSPAPKNADEDRKTIANRIITGSLLPNITEAQNADVNSIILTLKETYTKVKAGDVETIKSDRATDVLAYAVSPIALINKIRKKYDVLDTLLDQIK